VSHEIVGEYQDCSNCIYRARPKEEHPCDICDNYDQHTRIEINENDPWPDEDGAFKSTFPCGNCGGFDLWVHHKGFWCKNCGATYRVREDD